MPQLLKVQLPLRVGSKAITFGTILLQDDLGLKMERIKMEFWGNQEEITMEILREWMGKGQRCRGTVSYQL